VLLPISMSSKTEAVSPVRQTRGKCTIPHSAIMQISPSKKGCSNRGFLMDVYKASVNIGSPDSLASYPRASIEPLG